MKQAKIIATTESSLNIAKMLLSYIDGDINVFSEIDCTDKIISKHEAEIKLSNMLGESDFPEISIDDFSITINGRYKTVFC